MADTAQITTATPPSQQPGATGGQQVGQPGSPPPPQPGGPSPGGGQQGLSPADLQARYIEATGKYEAEKFQLTRDLKATKDQLAELTKQLERAKSDPAAFFQEAGGDLGHLTQRLVGGGPGIEERLEGMQQTIKTLQDQLTQQTQTAQQREEEARKAAYFGEHADEVLGVFGASQDYSDVSDALQLVEELYGASPRDRVAYLIRQPYEDLHGKTGRGLTPTESAGIIAGDARKLIAKLRESKALRKILGLEVPAQPAGATGAQPPPGSQQIPQQRTLPQGLQTGSPPADPSKMSDAEWVRWAEGRVKKTD